MGPCFSISREATQRPWELRLLTGGDFAYQPHADAPEILFPTPRNQDPGLTLLQGPWWEVQMGLSLLMAPATRGQQGPPTGSQSEPELSGSGRSLPDFQREAQSLKTLCSQGSQGLLDLCWLKV